MNECQAVNSPPDTGGVSAPSRKRCEATNGADGVVGIDEVFPNAFLEEVPFSTTPSAPLKEASRLLLDVAATPPMSGGEWRAVQFVTPSMTAHRCSCILQQPRIGRELPASDPFGNTP